VQRRSFVSVALLAAAGWPAAAAAAPDLELGRYLATECMTCHRSAGQPTTGAAGGAIPKIHGMAEPTFIEVVKAYRAKQLPNAVMQTVAARLKDDEIEALAAFFARAQP
jgi:cytochrome c